MSVRNEASGLSMVPRMASIAGVLLGGALVSGGITGAYAQGSTCNNAPIIIQPRIDKTPPTVAHFQKELSPKIPYDVNVAEVRKLDKEGKIQDAQRLFDIVSWQAFIALNWPIDAQGKPLPSVAGPPNGPRLADLWINSDQVFKPRGAPPDAWPSSTQKIRLWRDQVTSKHRRPSTVVNESLQAFSGPLVDQNGRWVKYQVLLNQVEYDYIVKNVLYNLEGQEAFSKRYNDDDPANVINEVLFPINKGTTQHGAIEVKFAWKVMGPGDVKSRFLRRQAEVLDPDTGKFHTEEVGLVGMHIAMRTESSPTWIWSTFEQVDNVKVASSVGPAPYPAKPNFYNPALVGAAVNTLPPLNAILDAKTGLPTTDFDHTKMTPTTWKESATRTPVQVTRVIPLDQPTQDLNAEVQAILGANNSVLRYYELIGTQWPVHPNAPAFASGAGSAPESIIYKMPGNVIPVFLVNTTMETFFQKGIQPAGPLEQDDRLAPGSPPIDCTPVFGTESCTGCHFSAGANLGFRKDPASGARTPIFGINGHFGKTGSANFSWLLQIEARSTHDPK